jgi:hypothetical protein
MRPNYSTLLPASFILDLTNALYSSEGEFFSKNNLRDCLSSGQLLSKLWCLQEIENLRNTKGLVLSKIHHLGCWHGLLSKYLKAENVVLVEKDENSLNLASLINPRALKVLEDALIYCKNYTVEETDCILNTSCEHMEDSWVEYLKPKTLVIAQSTNFSLGEGHINVKNSLCEFQQSLNLSTLSYCGVLEFPMYDRYMIIGYK